MIKKSSLICLISAGFISVTIVAPDMAFAQPNTLFEMLFGEKKSSPPQLAPQRRVAPRNQAAPKKQTPATPRKSTTRVVPIPIPAPKQMVQKLDIANNILVLGDFLSSGLADGLAEAFADNPSIRITDLSNGSSGLVRQDYYNWNQSVNALLDEQKPAAVIMMVGANDHQPIALAGENLGLLSDEWSVEYRNRIEQFIKTVETAGYPLIWVGQPPFHSRSMSKNMLAINEIYRQVNEKNTGNFVDIWDGFVGEDGAAITNGLDINGQEAQLRSQDDIGLTTAGKRKLAFYVEKPLRKILSDREQLIDPLIAPSDEAVMSAPTHITRIPAASIRDYGADNSGILMGGVPSVKLHKPQRQPDIYSPYPDRADYFLSSPAR